MLFNLLNRYYLAEEHFLQLFDSFKKAEKCFFILHISFNSK